MPTETPRQRLQQLLRELFQFDCADLDFGIYRIMNFRRKQLERFIEKDLLDAVAKGFEQIKKGESKEKEQGLAALAGKIRTDFGPDALDIQGNVAEAFRNTPLAKQYAEKKAELADIRISEQLEAELYSDIYNFFSRYWSDGDFLSLRRYSKQNKYAIPYNGEEVKLYWANYDQYYIKTTEYFKDYAFKADEYTVHFKIAAAQTEQNNVKGEKRFFLLSTSEQSITLTLAENGAKSLIILFEYRPLNDSEKITYGSKSQQEKINAEAEKKILDALADNRLKALLSSRKEEEERTLLGKHLLRYTRRNTTDYFIHKDLKGFLERELDFYIKNEILMLDDLDSESEVPVEKNLTKVRVLKQVCKKIIEFLAQLENFQKKLFEKRKFILETNYCMTIDNVPEEFYEEILANKEQLKEWKELFKLPIDAENGLLLAADDEQMNESKNSKRNSSNKTNPQPGLGLKSDPTKLDKGWLKRNPTLVLDTKFFNQEFKDRLLSRFGNVDEKIGGLLIRSENFQALSAMREKYRGQVKCIYIDPPFNAKSSEILYKNDFKHSSWIALMENRISISKSFLNAEGVVVVAIDENEQEKLGLCLEGLFQNHQKTCVTVEHNPSGQQGDNFSYTHEYAYFIYPKGRRHISEEIREENTDTRNFRDVTGEESLRTAAANCFYPIFVKDGKILGFGDVCADDFHPPAVNVISSDGTFEVYPIDPQGVERKWRFARQTVESIKEELKAHYLPARNVWDIKRTKSNFNYKTVWADSKYSANNHGTQLLNNIMGKEVFSYPKSIFTVSDSLKAALCNRRDAYVLDYFAGSGTTAHALLRSNKIESDNAKYLLVEMAEYFDTALKPRIEKIMYCTEWKDGKPAGKEGISHIFKYQTLESYEDALNNIQLQRPEQGELLEFDDYVLKYMLQYESRDSACLLNVEKLTKPFDYELELYGGGEKRKQKVDLIETFNYLLGVSVNQIKTYNVKAANREIKYRAIFGSVEGKSVIVIWRDTEGWDEETLKKDKEFIEKTVLDGTTPDFLYINGDSFVPNALPIEKTFKERMFAPILV
jgi:adenine-specific DNA-methyltransferase